MAERPHPPRAPDGYDVLAKWDTPSFDPPTREALGARLGPPPPRAFLDPDLFALLEAACARVMATPIGDPPLANFIDDDLAQGRGEGFRHPAMPPAGEAWRQGLAALEAFARDRFGQSFHASSAAQQDELLRDMAQGRAPDERFPAKNARGFFIHFLVKASAAHFYGQPQAWNEIGFGGPASPRGYVRLDLNRRDPWEAPFRRAPQRP